MSTDDLHEIFQTTEKKLIAVCITSALSIIAGIIITYHLVILWKLRYLPFIIKRHPMLVLATCSSLIITLLIERPLSAFSRLTRFSSLELSWTRWILHLICFETQYICVLFRIYITFFDVSFAKANAASLWVKFIDTQSKCKSSWIVTNYTKYGNLRTIYPFIIALILAMIVIVMILSIVDIAIGFLCNAVVLFFFTFLMCIIWCVTPTYLDSLKIRNEIRMLLVVQVCLLIANAVYVVNAAIMGSITYPLWLVLHCVAIFLIFLLAWIQTIWVLKKFKISVKKQKHRAMPESSVTDTWRSVTSGETREDEKQVLEVDLDIIDVISTTMGFEAFMNHLNKEFSMENLLALIEFNQFKQRYREMKKVKACLDKGMDPLTVLDRKTSTKNKITKIMTKMMKKMSVTTYEDVDQTETPQTQDDVADEKSLSIEVAEGTEITKLKKDVGVMKRTGTQLNVTEQVVVLPSTVPLSTIVYGEGYTEEDYASNLEKMKQMDLKTEAIRIIELLFGKYIVVGCQMELNLSHRLRKRYLNKLQNVNQMSEQQMEHVFDKCIVALLKLMQDSYSRFRQTKAFIRYEEKEKKRMRNDSLVTKDSLGGIFGDLM